MTGIWWYYYILTYFPSLSFWIGWWTLGGSEWFLLGWIKLYDWNCKKKKKKKERKKERKKEKTKITSITFIYPHSLQRNHKHTLRQNLFGFNLSEVFQKRKINKHGSSAIIYTIYHLLFETCWGMLAFCCFYTTQQRSVRLQKSRANVFQYGTCAWLVGR